MEDFQRRNLHTIGYVCKGDEEGITACGCNYGVWGHNRLQLRISETERYHNE